MADQQSILQESATDEYEDSDGEPARAELAERGWKKGDVVDLRTVEDGKIPFLADGSRWAYFHPRVRDGDPVLRTIDELPRHWNCLGVVTDVNPVNMKHYPFYEAGILTEHSVSSITQETYNTHDIFIGPEHMLPNLRGGDVDRHCLRWIEHPSRQRDAQVSRR